MLVCHVHEQVKKAFFGSLTLINNLILSSLTKCQQLYHSVLVSVIEKSLTCLSLVSDVPYAAIRLLVSSSSEKSLFKTQREREREVMSSLDSW